MLPCAHRPMLSPCSTWYLAEMHKVQFNRGNRQQKRPLRPRCRERSKSLVPPQREAHSTSPPQAGQSSGGVGGSRSPETADTNPSTPWAKPMTTAPEDPWQGPQPGRAARTVTCLGCSTPPLQGTHQAAIWARGREEMLWNILVCHLSWGYSMQPPIQERTLSPARWSGGC